MKTKPELLAEAKQRHDAAVRREEQHRSQINAMRRDLSVIARERKAAYRTWQSLIHENQTTTPD